MKINLPEFSILLLQKLELRGRNLESARKEKQEILVPLRLQRIPNKQLRSSKQCNPKMNREKLLVIFFYFVYELNYLLISLRIINRNKLKIGSLK